MTVKRRCYIIRNIIIYHLNIGNIDIIVQEHEFENLVSFSTKSNQGLTSWDDGTDILKQRQVVCTMRYQKIFMSNSKEGVCIDGIT